MKKFYFFLVALVLGVMSASAIDYYLIGGFQKPNVWTLKDPTCLFEAQGDGTYVLDYEGQLTSGFKINDGTWSNDAANFGSNGTKLVLGTPYNYGVGGSTSDISLEEGVVDNPHLVLDTNNGTLTITGQQAEVKITYDIWGNLPDQAEAWSATTLTNVEGDVWVAKDVNVTAQSDFGIRELTNGSQSNWIWATGNNEISGIGTFACGIQAESDGVNFSIAPGKWTLSFNAATMELVVTSGTDAVEGIDYYLIGGFQKPNVWTLKDPTCKFKAQGDGTYVLDYEGQLTSGFKINDGTWSNDAANFGSNGTKLALGTPYNYGVGGSTSDISLEEGVVDNPHLVLDTNNGTLTITGQQAEVKITYDILGNLPDQAEAWSATTLTNVEGDVWVAKDVNVTAQSDFGIRELTNGSQSNWIWATGNNEISGIGTFACGIQAESDGVNFSIAPGKWTLSFNAATMELVVTSGTDAVEGIEVEENVAPVYYNLQGVRVAEPTNGLYIVVRGDKVAKELVK